MLLSALGALSQLPLNNEFASSQDYLELLVDGGASSSHLAVVISAIRTAFATHLIENGTDIHFIQKLLGHRRIETTTIYTHVAKLKSLNVLSPMDSLGNNNRAKKQI
jgi:integrase